MNITVGVAHRINHINAKLLNLIENYSHRATYKNGIENWLDKTVETEEEKRVRVF